MNNLGTFVVHIQGSRGALKLSPTTYDITELREILSGIDDLLYPGQKKDRPLITYDLQEGSVRHVFQTGMQAIISLTAVLSQIQVSQSLDFLDQKTSQVIENLQHVSSARNYEIQLSTSQSSGSLLTISPATHWERTANTMVEAEFYFYGELTNAGGKDKVNVHLDTKEFGSLRLETSKDLLAEGSENILYRHYGIRAKGLQNIETGEFDKNSLKFVDFVNYSPRYDAEYLDGLIAKAEKNWAGIDAEAWLADLRGSDGV